MAPTMPYDPLVTEPAGGYQITVPDAASLLGLRPHTVYRLIEEGKLGAVQTMSSPPQVGRAGAGPSN